MEVQELRKDKRKHSKERRNWQAREAKRKQDEAGITRAMKDELQRLREKDR